MIQDPDAATGLAEAEGLLHERCGVRGDGVDIRQHDMIERGFWQVCGFGIEQLEIDILKAMARDGCAGPLQHLLRDIDSEDLDIARIERQHKPAADADFENSVSGLGVEDAGESLSSVMKDGAKGQVIESGEPIIRMADGKCVDCSFRHRSRCRANGQGIERWLRKCLFLPLVEGLLVGDAGAVFGLQLLGDLFDLAEDAEEVAAEDFAAILSGVAASHEGGGDFGQVGGGVESLGELAADAVEVGAQTDVINAGDFGDVVNVVNED